MADVVLRFVDAISSSRTVRMNLADFTVWRPQDDCRFDSPQPLRARAGTMLSNGVRYPGSKHEERTIELHWWLQTASTSLALEQIQALAAELNRPFNILEYQPPNVASSRFFITVRLAEELQIVYPTDGTLHDVRATIIAEPYGYGLLETPVNGATLNRDPANASNGTFVDVTGVKGDVETPTLIKLPSGAALRETLFAVRRRGTPSAAPNLFQAEALTQGTDTATQVNDANFSGSSNNYSRCTFATVATMATRLTLSDLGTASVDLRGRYRVYLRYRKNTSGDSITMQLVWGTSGGTTTINDLFTTPATTNICIADLGEIQIPRGWDPVYDGKSGVELALSDTFHAALQVQRVSGSGSIDLDFLRPMPADPTEKMAIVRTPEVPAGVDHWLLDADDNSISARNSSAQVMTAQPASIAGSLPYLSPGQTNRLHILYEIAAGATYALTTQTISISYMPRYL